MRRITLRAVVRIAAWTFVGVGLCAVGVAVAADALGIGGQAGFGGKQILLAAGGLAFLLLGTLLSLPGAYQRMRSWREWYVAARTQSNALLLHPIDHLFLAIWFGLATGLIEVAYLLFQKLILQEIIYASRDFTWMTPAAYVIVFATVGLALYVIAQNNSAFVPAPLAVGVYTFIGLTSLYYLYPKIHFYTAILLFAGIATQVARTVQARPHLFKMIFHLSAVRFTAPPVETEQFDQLPLLDRRRFLVSSGAAIAGMAIGRQGWQRTTEVLTLDSLVRSTPDTPNVLFIVLDTVRAQSLSLYGYNRPTTPQLAYLADRGITFEQAIATSPWTLPSHGSMFTGQYPHELTADWQQPIDDTYPTLAEVLSAQGYVTAGFAANTLYTTYEFGLNRGFSHYEDFRTSLGQVMNSPRIGRKLMMDRRFARFQHSWRKTAEQLNHDFLQWLAHVEDGRPFFAFLNYFDAHDPYLPPTEFALQFSDKQPRSHLLAGESITPAETEELRDAYDACIAYLDHSLGQLFESLDRQNALDNTFVIVVGDHGEQFGEHDLMLHGNSLYLPLLHVPLLLVFPATLPTGSTVVRPVTLRDIPATIIDVLALDTAFTFPGRSLARFWANTAGTPLPEESILSEVKRGWAFPEWYPGMQGPMKSLILGNTHYIKNYGNGREELYDLERDPEERHDLANTAQGQQALSQLRATLDTILSG